MKKIVLTLTAFFVTLLTFAQSPYLMNYQGVARNAAGNVLPNQSISLKLNIRSGSPSGGVVYSETRTMLTNAFGLFNVVVGSPGATSVTGTIAGINWTAFGSGSGNKYLQVEIDPNGGSSFTSVGSTQLVSVPYALNAASAAPVGPAGGDLTGTYPNPQIFFPLLKTFNASTLTPANTELIGMTNSATTGTLGAITGKSASTSASANAITGTMTSTSPGSFSTAVRGVNNGTGGSGIGVWGSQDGSGWGVNGTSNSGIGVYGWSPSGVGTLGSSGTSTGIWGLSNTSNSGLFNNTNAANTAATVGITTNGTGPGLNSTTTGTGRAGWFEVNNAASTANALEASTNGVGASWAIRGNSSGTNGAGLFVQSNAANTANNVQSNQAGLGRAGLFQNTNTANNADALTGTTVTTGTTAAGVHGIAGSSGISVVAKKGGWGESDAGLGLLGTSSSGNGVFGVTNTGVAGVVGVSVGNGTGVLGTSVGGVAADFSLTSPNNSNVVNATTSGGGTVINADNTGTGLAGTFRSSNAASTSLSVYAAKTNTTTTGAGNATVRVDRGPILPNTFVYTGLPTASLNLASSGIGVMGSSVNGLGVAALTFNGIALRGQAIDASGYGLVTTGQVQIQGQGAATNRIFGATNAAGDGTWRTAASLGLVSGSGTLNYVPKWTPDGVTIGNSQLYDNGTNVGIGTTSPNGKLDVVNPDAANRGIVVNNTNTANANTAVYARSTNTTYSNIVESSAITASYPISVATSLATGVTGIKSIASTSAAVSQFSGIGIQGVSNAGYGIIGSSTTGVGLAGIGWGTGYGLYTFGKLQFEGQGAATNRLMVSDDANGNATWHTLASINGVSGNGTLNYMTKWSPDGTTIANSQVFDNGVSLGVGTTTPNGAARIDVQSTISQMRLMDSDDNSELWFSAPGTAYTGGIGTGTNHDLPLFTNSIDRMTIKSNGLIGINTAAPVSMLDVDNTAAGQGGLRVNQPAELNIPAVKSLSNGVIVSDASVLFPALLGTNSIYAQRGDWVGGTLTSSILNETAVMGVSVAGTGMQGVSITGRGVFAGATNGVGLRAYSLTDRAIHSSGGLQFTGIGEAAGSILTGDAAGNANWSTPAAAGIISGAGTLNYVPKFTPDGSTIGNSQIFDDGTFIGIGTATPGYNLEMQNASANPTAYINQNNGANTSSALLVRNRDNLNAGDLLLNNTISSIRGTGGTATYITNTRTSLYSGTSSNAVNGIGVVSYGPWAGTVGLSGDGGTGLYGWNTGTGYGLVTLGRVQIQGQGAAAGNVLTSDAAGNATWQNLITPAVGISIKDLTAPQSIPSNIVTDITTWANVVYEDGGANFNAGTGEYTITVAGLYSIHASVDWGVFTAAPTVVGGHIAINNVFVASAFSNAPTVGTFPATSTVTYDAKLNVGDKVKVQAFQDSGAAVNLNNIAYATKFSVRLVK